MNKIRLLALCAACGLVFLFSSTQFAFAAPETPVIPYCQHVWGQATYTWSEDYSTCTATRVCSKNAKHKQSETVQSVRGEETPATPTEPATVMYTASFQNEVFKEQTKLVEIGEPLKIVWGDATGDGKVNNTDIVRLKNYLANYDDDSGISTNGITTYVLEPGADATADGVVNNTDIVRLKNYLANFDDELGISTNGTTEYILGPKG